MESAKVAVLVGVSSNLKLELGTAVRATSVEEMLSLLSVCPDLEFAVIEKELDCTDQKVVDMAKEAKSKRVLCLTYSASMAQAFGWGLVANEDEVIGSIKTGEFKDTNAEVAEDSTDVVTNTEKVEVNTEKTVYNTEKVDTSASDKVETLPETEVASDEAKDVEMDAQEAEANGEKIRELEDKLQVKTIELEEMSKRLEMLVNQMADTEGTSDENTEELRQAVERLEGFNNSLEADRQQLKSDLDKAQAELRAERAEKIRLSTDLQLEQDKTKSMEANSEEVQGKQRSTQERLEDAEAEAKGWRVTAEDYVTDMADLLIELFGCLHEIEAIKQELGSIQSERDKLKSQKDATSKTLEDTLTTLAEKSDLVEKLGLAISEKENEISELVTLREKLEGQNEYSEGRRQQNQAEISQLKGNLSEKLEELNTVKAQADADKARYAYEIERISQELASEKSERSRLEIELQAKVAELEGLRAAYEILQDKLKNSLSLGESMTAIGQGLGQAVTEVGLKTNDDATEKELERLKSELSASEDRAGALQQEVNTLREKCEQLEQVKYSTVAPTTGATSSPMECRYTGNCKIIPVFGSGSYGVTTMAMSLALRNQAERILYMDFDLSSPKADGWFNVNPLNDRLTGIRARILKSGVGVLSEFGAESLGYIQANIGNVIQTVSNKSQAHGRIDYFSGIYGALNEDNLRAVDFTGLFEYLGSRYDYIYIDLGKLAAGKIQSELTAMICGIAHKVVVVTKNDKFAARNFSVKLMEYGIKTDGMVWALNMVTSTAIDTLTKKAIGTAEVVIIPFSQEMLEGNVSFGRSYTLRSKLNEVAEKIG